jgi:DNA-binding protein H-NS
MSEFFDILSHKGRAKAALKKLTIEQLESLQEIVSERLREAQEEHHQSMVFESKREQTLQKVAEVGMSLDGSTVPVPKKRKQMVQIEDKYQITDIHGFQRNWSGFGHAPVQFKQAFSEGLMKEDMLKDKQAMLKVAFTDTARCVQLVPETAPSEPQGKTKKK